MISLTFLKKLWLLFILGVLAGILAFLWFLARQPKQAPPEEPREAISPPESRFSDPAQVSGYKLLAPAPKIPEALEAFSVQNYSKDNLPDPFKAVAGLFGISLNKEPSSPLAGIFVWEEEPSYASLSVPSGRFNILGKKGVSQQFSYVSAQEYAVNKTLELSLAPSIAGAVTKSYVVIGGHLQETSPYQANYFIVQINPGLAGFPIVGVGPAQIPIEFRLTKEGQLLGISKNVHTPVISMGTYPSRTWEEVLSSLEAGEAKTLWVRGEEGDVASPLDQGALSNIVFSRAYLAYYDTGERQEVIQPIFVFEGTGETGFGEKREIAVYVPAVKGELISP